MSANSSHPAGLSAAEKRALLAQKLQARAAAPKLAACSFAQERLWLLDQLTPGNFSYNVPTAIRISGSLDIDALGQSLNMVVARHEVLRTTFTVVEGKPNQRIAPALTIPIATIDLCSHGETEQTVEVERLATAEAQRPFDLAQGPLLRATLLKLAEAEYVLFLTLHHIVSDGWSLGVLVRELGVLYAAFSTRTTPQLPNLPIQYADFATWQRNWLSGAVLEQQLDYWKQQFNGDLAALDLPTDQPRPPVQTFRGGTQLITLPEALSQALKQLSRQEGVTPFMTLLAAFQVLLYRYTGQPDIRVGTPIANRNRLETEALIGFFVNTLVLRADCAGNPRFLDLLQQVRQRALGAYAHQDLPFEKLVEQLHLDRDLSRTPLFQVMFMLQNTPRPPLELQGLTISPLEVHSGTAKFDLTLSMVDTADGFVAEMIYNADLFEAATIERMLEHFQVLLAGIVAAPEQHIARLPLLTPAEQHRWIVDFNATDRDIPAVCLPALFAAQVERTPDAIAVEYGAERLTYRELDQRSNQLAHRLQRLGVGPDVLVGICIERSPLMMIGLLGILKAGGAYLPLDASYPRERLAVMLDDARPPVLVTQQPLLPVLPYEGRKIVCLDVDWPSISQEPATEPMSVVDPDNLAYVIYTSGSTGTPKGIQIPHRGLVNYLTWCVEAYGVVDGIGAPVHSSISFDLTITGLFAPLLAGRSVYPLPEAQGLDALSRALQQQEQYSLVKLTPKHLELLSHQIPASAAAGRARAFIVGGENLLAEHLAFWQSAAPETLIVNEYGPTETVVGCCVYQVLAGDSTSGVIPIGQPIANTQIYLLDAFLQPVPIGVAGELYIGGLGVARGYLNRPALTAEKFVPDPFAQATRSGARLYRTGDLARYLPDGNIEFLGRNDHQVKLRGFRIELDEIEAVLLRHAAMREAAVAVYNDPQGESRLVAYVVAHTDQPLDLVALRDELKQQLPDYMVPTSFVTLDALPLTSNGKVDRKALPNPETGRSALATEYTAPQNEIERVIAAVWQAVLQLDQVGTRDNFFDLGGHSLLLAQVQNKLRTQLSREITLIDLFKHTTISALAAWLQTDADEQQPALAESFERAEGRRASLSRRNQRRPAHQPAPRSEEEEDDE